MGIMVYSLLWVMQDLYHQPYVWSYVASGRLELLEFGFISTLKPKTQALSPKPIHRAFNPKP